MLLLKLKKETVQEAVFDYFPENKGDFGTLLIDKNSGELQILKTAVSDKHGIYITHACGKIRNYFSENEYKIEECVAWY